MQQICKYTILQKHIKNIYVLFSVKSDRIISISLTRMVWIFQAETIHFPLIYTLICEGSMKCAIGIISLHSPLCMLCNLLEIEMISNHFFLFSCQARVLFLSFLFSFLRTFFSGFNQHIFKSHFSSFKMEMCLQSSNF